ncbi:hypothetical protein OQA88_5007 [Cercophora sp. LCS_1]
MSRISVPTAGRLRSDIRVNASNPAVTKILSRLSRASLLSIALEWLDDTESLATPYLAPADDDIESEDEDDLNPAVASREALVELYTTLQARKGSKREVLDRILEGDWRHGLTLYQLAIADLQYLYDHPLSQKWTAYRIVPLKPLDPNADHDDNAPPMDEDKQSLTIPRFHPSTFIATLHTQVLPDVKVHYNFDRHQTLPIFLLRIFILESPYNTALSTSAVNFETSRTVYIAFPDNSPHVFISKPQSLGVGGSGGGEAKSLRSLIVEGVPKALSRPRQRVTLKSTSLVTRNLEEMVERRGAGRTNLAGGGWGWYADEKLKESPLDLALPTPPLSEEDDGKGKGKRRAGVTEEEKREERSNKRKRLVAKARFGESAKIGDRKGVERVDIVIEDPFPTARGKKAPVEEVGDDEDEMDWESGASRGRKSRANVDLTADQENDDIEGGHWRPFVRLTFHGSHVFAGIRQLVEHGIIDGERMPGWMTGEEGVTVGAVRNGRIRGNKGSGV